MNPIPIKIAVIAAMIGLLGSCVYVYGKKQFHAGELAVQAKWNAAESQRKLAEAEARAKQSHANAQAVIAQAQIAQRTEDDYQKLLARVRSMYASGGVRKSAAADNPADGVSATAKSASVTDAATADIGFDTRGNAAETACLQDAAITTAQLLQLQTWIQDAGLFP